MLYNKEGKRFTNELLPRDLLTKEILKQMEKDRTDYVMLDMRPMGEKTIKNRIFHNIHQHCLDRRLRSYPEKLSPLYLPSIILYGGIGR